MFSWRRGNPEYKAKLNLKGLEIGHQMTKEGKAGFKKGFTTWNKGVPQTETTKNKIRLARKGQVFPFGANHWNWTGGRMMMTRAIRGLSQYREWRTAVFTRDNYTCQGEGCGVRSGKGCTVFLEADHIIPASIILKSFKVETTEQALTVPFLWDIRNGRTLCEECHRKTDSFGVKIRWNAPYYQEAFDKLLLTN